MGVLTQISPGSWQCLVTTALLPEFRKGKANSGCEICGVLFYIWTRWSAVVNIKNSICSIIGWINHDALNSLWVALFIYCMYSAACFLSKRRRKPKLWAMRDKVIKDPQEKYIFIFNEKWCTDEFRLRKLIISQLNAPFVDLLFHAN